MSSIYTPRPWIVSARMWRTEETATDWNYRAFQRGTWHAAATYNDGSVKSLGSWSDSETGYPRRGGSGRGAAYVACAVALGYNKPSDRECRQLFRIPGLVEYERPEGGKARTVPTGRERMRRLGIRPDVKPRPDMSARERYKVAYRAARLRHGAGMAEHYAAKAMVPRFRRYAHGTEEYTGPSWGAAIGGYDVRTSQRGKPDWIRPYVPSPGSTACQFAREGGGKVAPDRHWILVSYRKSIAHARSGRMRFSRYDPAMITQYQGDKVADYQEGKRGMHGEYIYPHK